jgi:hypothetical protein
MYEYVFLADRQDKRLYRTYPKYVFRTTDDSRAPIDILETGTQTVTLSNSNYTSTMYFIALY